MKKHIETEIKVGMFVSFGVALIMLAILIVGGQSLIARKNTYTSHFPAIDGLISGSKVTIGGVPVGVVDAIDFDYENHNIVVKFSVLKKATEWVRKDSNVEIATQGVLGDKYISIDPGSKTADVLPDGADIPIRMGKDLSQFLSKGDQLMVTLNSISGSLDRILKNFEADNRSTTFFKGISDTARNMGQASEKLNRELDQIQLKQAIGSLSHILEKVNDGTGTIGALINDPSLYDQLKALFGGANRNRIIRNLVRQTIKDSEKNGDPKSIPTDPSENPAH